MINLLKRGRGKLLSEEQNGNISAFFFAAALSEPLRRILQETKLLFKTISINVLSMVLKILRKPKKGHYSNGRTCHKSGITGSNKH